MKISATLNAETGQVSGVINNANSITGNLAKQNDTINRIMGNVSALTRQLSNAPIQKTLADLEQTAAQLQGIMDKINSNKGSLGMLINDKEVYNNLNGTLKSVTALTDDLKAHPKRYINLSVFGGKDKEGGKK